MPKTVSREKCQSCGKAFTRINRFRVEVGANLETGRAESVCIKCLKKSEAREGGHTKWTRL
jgi:hypothetical protein